MKSDAAYTVTLLNARGEPLSEIDRAAVRRAVSRTWGVLLSDAEGRKQPQQTRAATTPQRKIA